MSVELAVVMPVCIVVGLIAFNLMRFGAVCAEFDRVARGAVLAHGVAPEGEQSLSHATGEVERCIEEALGSDGIDVAVEAEGAWEGDGASARGRALVSPLLTRYTCTLRLRPWPHALSLGGVSFEPPAWLEHRTSIVVDRYRSGVVV